MSEIQKHFIVKGNHIMNTPLVSIIVPIYNAQDYLSQCVDSLLKQTYTNLDVILVDDGSTDDSGALCDTYASDPRVHVVHKINGGISSARNAGLDVAQGDYIAFCDNDDYLHPQMIEILLSTSVSKGCDLSICGLFCVEEGRSVTPPPIYAAELAINRITALRQSELYQGLFSTQGADFFPYAVVWNKLYSRKLIEGLRFRDGGHEDGVFNAEVYKRCRNAYFIHVPLYFYFLRATSVSHSSKDCSLKDTEAFYYMYRQIVNDLPPYAAMCLSSIYRRMLYATFCYCGTEYEAPMRQCARQIMHDTYRTYLSNRYIQRSLKFQFVVFWHCPWLYRFCYHFVLPLLRR